MITENKCVLSTIKESLKLECVGNAPKSGIVQTKVKGEQLDIILSAVETLLQKGAIEQVLQQDLTNGLYSTFLIVNRKQET